MIVNKIKCSSTSKSTVYMYWQTYYNEFVSFSTEEIKLKKSIITLYLC